MSNKQINRKLIQILTNTSIEQIPAMPTFKHLGGTYVKSIVDNLKKIELQNPVNDMTMKCMSCGKSGKYNVGIIAVSPKNPKSRQYTGYFRCKHCNEAGPWKEPMDIQMLTMAAVIARNENLPVHFGEIALSDGYEPPYATDAEEHYIQLIKQQPDNALLWNKLGNSYKSGGRPELAMAAFEKSLTIDANQLESHLSIANMLYEIRDYKNAVHHFHQMMLVADRYTHLPPVKLRELLSYGILNCLIAVEESKNKFSPIPTKEQFEASGSSARLQTEQLFLSSEDISTFYPLAEGFMGKLWNKKQRKAPNKQAPRTVTKAQQVKAFISTTTRPFTKSDIQRACPDVSITTISNVVRELRKAGKIIMSGSGTSTRWHKL